MTMHGKFGSLSRSLVPSGAFGALGVAAALSLGAVGCGGSKELTVSASATVLREGNTDVMEIVVTTAPNATVSIHDSGYTQTWNATADFLGQAKVRVPLPEPTAAPKVNPPPPKYGSTPSYTSTPSYAAPRPVLLGPEIKLGVNVSHYTPRKLFKSRYQSAQTSLTVTRPAAVRFDPSTRQIACLGKACTGTFNIYQDARLDFTDIEPVSTVALGPEQARTVTRQLSLTLELRPFLEKVPLNDMFKPYPMGNIDLPLELGFNDGTKVRTNVNIGANQLKPALMAAFAKVAQGPVLFPGEEAAPGNHTSLVNLSRQTVLGNATKVRDVDLVAVVTDKDRPGCGTEGSMEADITVYERRTGKAIGTRHFSAPSCKDDYDDAAAEAWVKSFVKAS